MSGPTGAGRSTELWGGGSAPVMLGPGAWSGGGDSPERSSGAKFPGA